MTLYVNKSSIKRKEKEFPDPVLEAHTFLNSHIDPNKPRVGGTGDASNAKYGIVFLPKDGGEVTEYYNTYPCHGQLHSFKGQPYKTTPLSLYSIYVKNRHSEEAVIEAYHSWVTNKSKSPWRQLLTNYLIPHKLGSGEVINSTEYTYSKGFIFDNLDKMPANLMVNFFIGTRMQSEWPDYINSWHKMVTEYGCDPSLAFVFITLFNTLGLGMFRWQTSKHNREVTISAANKYDWPIDMATCDEEYVTNFILGIPVNYNAPFGQTLTYTPVNSLWGNNKHLVTGHTYANKLKSLYNKQFGEMQTPGVLGFGQLPGTAWTLSYEEVINILKLETERLYSIVSSSDGKSSAKK